MVKKIDRLKHITLTGVDTTTDLQALKQLQDKYPLVEFGVLLSRKWNLRGYSEPADFSYFKNSGLNLSLHVCGTLAKQAYNGDWNQIIDITQGAVLNTFSRAQLNVSEREGLKAKEIHLLEGLHELIIQQKSIKFNMAKDFIHLKEKNPELNISMLIDPSGGRGIDFGLELVSAFQLVGYAGGINQNNIEGKLRLLLNSRLVSDFWIDMESSVRENNHFSIEKAEIILQKCYSVLDEMKDEEMEP